MSRTVRCLKVMYLVAVILMSSEDMSDKLVERIVAAPHVEVKGLLQPRKIYRGVEKASRGWFGKFDVFGLSRIKSRLLPLIDSFTIWTIPNILLDYSTGYINRKLLINSDCDMIYNK